LLTLLVLMINGYSDEIAVLDSVYVVTDEVITGELKSIKSGKITIETEYSDKDFIIDWEKVTRISTTTPFLVTTTKGSHITGTLSGNTSDTIILNGLGRDEALLPNEIVNATQSNKKFIDKLSASIDFGYLFKKAKNEQQFNGAAHIGYATDKLRTSTGYNGNISKQDSVDLSDRHEWSLSFNYYLPRNLFPIVSINFLKSTELNLSLRTTGKAGLGYYFFNTSYLYWNVSGGFTTLREIYTTENDTTKTSAEVYIGSELNIYDIGDLSLRLIGNVYKGITEKNRIRGDTNFDIKYDLPLDFYLKGALIVDYDNQPAENSGRFDYQFSIGAGWEL